MDDAYFANCTGSNASSFPILFNFMSTFSQSANGMDHIQGKIIRQGWDNLGMHNIGCDSRIVINYIIIRRIK